MKRVKKQVLAFMTSCQGLPKDPHQKQHHHAERRQFNETTPWARCFLNLGCGPSLAHATQCLASRHVSRRPGLVTTVNK